MEMITHKLVECAKPQVERTHPEGQMDRYLRLIDTFPFFFKPDSAPISLSAPLPPASLPSFPSQRRHSLPHLTRSTAPLGSVKTWPCSCSCFTPVMQWERNAKLQSTTRVETKNGSFWGVTGWWGVMRICDLINQPAHKHIGPFIRERGFGCRG